MAGIALLHAVTEVVVLQQRAVYASVLGRVALLVRAQAIGCIGIIMFLSHFILWG